MACQAATRTKEVNDGGLTGSSTEPGRMAEMKFLLYSQCGEGAQVLKRIELEGNDCALFIKDKLYTTVFDGLIAKCTQPDSFIDKDTIILFDMSGNGAVADSYKSKG